MSSSTALVRKLIAVLESIEKLPVYNYDTPGAGYGLQVGISPPSFNLKYKIYILCTEYATVVFLITCQIRFINSMECNTAIFELDKYLKKQWVLQLLIIH